MKPLPLLDGRSIGQIGILVADLECAVSRYSAIFDGGPWRAYTYGPATVRELSYQGQPGEYSMRLAIGSQTPQIELIQPLAGPSIYDEWLDKRGEGFHHVGVFVDSLDAAIKDMRSAGYDVLQSGHGTGADGSGGFAYFSTEGDLSIILEAIVVPRRRRDPEVVWD